MMSFLNPYTPMIAKIHGLSEPQRNSFDIESVALHEIGHIVGLAHSTVAGAVMQSTISSNATLRALTQDDIDGFNALYAKVPQCIELGKATAEVAVRTARLVPLLHGTLPVVYSQDRQGGVLLSILEVTWF